MRTVVYCSPSGPAPTGAGRSIDKREPSTAQFLTLPNAVINAASDAASSAAGDAASNARNDTARNAAESAASHATSNVTGRSITLSILPGSYAVCRCQGLPAVVDTEFFAVTCESGEWTVVCSDGDIPSGISEVEKDWIVLRAAGPFAFTEIGVLASIVGPLAAAGVSVYALSTFGTDYVLVKQGHREVAVRSLREAGHVVEGERDGC